MKNHNMILTEAAKIPALSSAKIDKYEYFTGEGILPCNQSRMIEQCKFSHFPLGKAFEKQIKTIENHGEKNKSNLRAWGTTSWIHCTYWKIWL